MRVAVSGATGFIGHHVCAALESRGDDVVALGRGADGRQAVVDADGAVVDGDGASLESLLEGVDAVVHLAGRTVDSFDTPLAAYLDANVVLTEDLLRAAAAVGADRFVHASTRLAYPATEQAGASESSSSDPDTFYGLSKVMGEHVVRLHARREGLTATSLRLAQVVGPGDGGRGALPRFAQQARDGRLVVHGRGLAVRDLVHVDDVVGAVLATLDHDAPPGLVNIGGGAVASVADMALAVARAAGLDTDAIEHVDVEHEDTSHYELDVSLAASTLGWRPQVDLDEMARRSVAS